jgi:hypothetical protein
MWPPANCKWNGIGRDIIVVVVVAIGDVVCCQAAVLGSLAGLAYFSLSLLARPGTPTDFAAVAAAEAVSSGAAATNGTDGSSSSSSGSSGLNGLRARVGLASAVMVAPYLPACGFVISIGFVVAERVM